MPETHGCGRILAMSDHSKMAERLLAHATMCQEAASLSWDEAIAFELEKLADGCRQAAAMCEPEPAEAPLHYGSTRSAARATLGPGTLL